MESTCGNWLDCGLSFTETQPQHFSNAKRYLLISPHKWFKTSQRQSRKERKPSRNNCRNSKTVLLPDNSIFQLNSVKDGSKHATALQGDKKTTFTCVRIR